MEGTKNTSSFIALSTKPRGHVSVKLRKNQFNKEGNDYYGVVMQNLYSAKNIIDDIAKDMPGTSTGMIADILNSYARSLTGAISKGYSVKFGEMGVFRLASNGRVTEENPVPSLEVRFSPSEVLHDAVKNVDVNIKSYSQPKAEISGVTDITSGACDGSLNTCATCLLEGKGIKIGGIDSGVFFIPVNKEGKQEQNEEKWIPVTSPLAINKPSKLLFAIPKNLETGKSYTICIKTRIAYHSNYERKYLIQAISKPVHII